MYVLLSLYIVILTTIWCNVSQHCSAQNHAICNTDPLCVYLPDNDLCRPSHTCSSDCTLCIDLQSCIHIGGGGSHACVWDHSGFCDDMSRSRQPTDFPSPDPTPMPTPEPTKQETKWPTIKPTAHFNIQHSSESSDSASDSDVRINRNPQNKHNDAAAFELDDEHHRAQSIQGTAVTITVASVSLFVFFSLLVTVWCFCGVEDRNKRMKTHVHCKVNDEEHDEFVEGHDVDETIVFNVCYD
eukprot:692193_1